MGQIAELRHQIEHARVQLAEATSAHERDREELQILQERARENEIAGIKRNQSDSSLVGDTSLGAELEEEESETKTEYASSFYSSSSCSTLNHSLKIHIRSLERQLGELQLSTDGQQSASALRQMLEESNRARDRYQADYNDVRNQVLQMEAQLEYIRSGTGGHG